MLNRKNQKKKTENSNSLSANHLNFLGLKQA